MFNSYKSLLLVLALSTVSVPAFSLNDPTRPSQYTVVGKKQDLRLESVFLGTKRKVAVINGGVVTEGDTIEGVKIININKDSVKVSRDGVTSLIEINSTSIRQEK